MVIMSNGIVGSDGSMEKEREKGGMKPRFSQQRKNYTKNNKKIQLDSEHCELDDSSSLQGPEAGKVEKVVPSVI